MRTWVGSKLHGIVVTDAAVHYHGSVTIGADLMEAADIAPYEWVAIVNLANGHRWETYAIPGPLGCFTLNGGGARLGVVGDECVVMTRQTAPTFPGARVVFCQPVGPPRYPVGNTIAERSVYP